MNENIIDPTAIERLKRLGGAKFAAEMLDMFRTYGGKKLIEARLAQKANDLPALAAAAHPLKSSAGNVGAVRVQELAARVEQTARAQQGEAAAALLLSLEQAFVDAEKILEVEKSNLMKPPA
jgi:HPt (histidine-containing phosphotransfer) domain-containing protein